MIKTLSLQHADMDYVPALERWYYAVHSAQVARRFGPWLARHESYMPVYSPPEAEKMGCFNWRFINSYWYDIPQGIDGELAFDPSPVPFLCADATTPAQPTEEFKGMECKSDKNVLRFIQLIKYPDGVDKKEADRWYVETFAPEACKQEHMYKFISYKTIKDAPHKPGHIDPKDFEVFTAGGITGWDRYSEMWYESYADWREDMINNPPKYTLPSWATQDTFPFVRPVDNFVCSFILEKPTDNYLAFDRIYV